MRSVRLCALILTLWPASFPSAARADGTGVAISKIAVGSSTQLWGIDAANHQILYRRNPRTLRFEPVQAPNGVLDVDVNAAGVVGAVLADQHLYYWSESAGFVQQTATPATIQLKHIALGPDSALGIDASGNATLCRATSWQGLSKLASCVALGKADDSAWLVDATGKTLFRWDDASQTLIQVATAPGTTQMVDLSVLDAETVWVLTNDGGVHQWNPKTGGWVDHSARLPQNLELTEIELDDAGVLVGLGSTGLSFHEVGDFALDLDVGPRRSKPVLTIAGDGTQHVLYVHQGALYHSSAPVGADGKATWLDATPIPGSTSGTDLQLAVAADGTLHASWIGGVGNAREVYYAQGQPLPGIGGYAWSDAMQVSNDQATDQGLAMVLTPRGGPVFLTTKRDAESRLADRDLYQHVLDFEARPPNFDGKPRRDTYRASMPFVLQNDPWRARTGNSGLLGGSTSGVVLPAASTFGYTWELVPDKLWATAWFYTLGLDFEAGHAGIKTGGILELEFTPISDPIELSIFVVVDAGYEWVGPEQSWQTGVELEVEVLWPLVKGESKAIDALNELTDVDWEFGLMGLFTGEVAELDLLEEDGGSAGLLPDEVRCFPQTTKLTLTSSSPPTYISVTDKDGNPPTSATPVSDLRAHIDWDQLASYVGGMLLGSDSAPAPLGAGTPPLRPAPSPGDPNEVFQAQGWTSWTIGAGLFADYTQKSDGKSIFEAHARAVGSALFDGSKVSGVDERLEAWLQFGPWNLTLVDADISTSTGSAPTLDYAPGGTTAVHGPGLMLGTGNGSNVTDESEISVAMLNGVAYGAFEQETGDAQFQAIYTIQGTPDPQTGAIAWDESSVAEVTGSGGFDSSPELCAYQDGGANKLVVAWSGVASSNPDVQTLAQTPPGRAYLVQGFDPGTSAGVDLDTFTETPPTNGSPHGFYYSNTDALYSIGARVAAVRDVDGNGKPDFFVGAPDAEVEEGRAYLVLGEHYAAETTQAIDARKGIYGLTLTGAADSELGAAVSSAGDYNHDGKPDLMVSAPGALEHAGAVHVLFGGAALAQSTGPAPIDQSALAGLTLTGADGEQLGSALGGGVGLDATGDNHDDLLVGAASVGAVYLYTGGTGEGAPLAGGRRRIVAGAQTAQGDPGQPLGSDVALLPDVNGDHFADVLLGSGGRAFLLFGGPRLDAYTSRHVLSWSAQGQNGDTYQVVLSFDGTDTDGDGVLRGRAAHPTAEIGTAHANELVEYTREVFRDGVLLETAQLATDAADSYFNFNYDLADEQLLAKGEWSAPDGLHLGGGSTSYVLWGDSDLQLVALSVPGGATNYACSPQGNDQFTVVCEPGQLDLIQAAVLPALIATFTLDSNGAPLHVGAAGDANGDGFADLLVGVATAQDDTGAATPGSSYLVYGRSDLPTAGKVGLAGLTAAQGLVLGASGAVVGPAGDVDGDHVDDFFVADPAASGGQPSVSIYLGKKSTTTGHPAITISDTDALQLAGSGVAPVGDLDGDGRGELVIGAPHTGDANLISNLSNETRITCATLPHVGMGASWTTAPFPGTSTQGIGPLALGGTGQGALLVWNEPPDPTTGRRVMYGSFLAGGVWSTGVVLRSTADVIGEASISDPWNGANSSSSTPTVAWQESDPTGARPPTLWEARYDAKAANWNTSEVSVEPGTTSPGAPNNDDASLTLGATSYRVVDTSVSEGAGQATVTFERTGDLTVEHELFYRTVDLSATAGADYRHQVGKVRFAKGERFQHVGIPLLEDSVREPGECVRIELYSLDPKAHRTRNGRRVSGFAMTAGTLQLSSTDRVQELSAIDSGFILAGQPAVELGGATAPAGDVNGDHVADFLAGAPGANSNAGLAYVVYGRAGIELLEMGQPLDYLTASQGVVLSAGVVGGRLGAALAGDTIAGGWIAVGAPGGATTSGNVYVVKKAALNGKSSLFLSTSDALVLKGQGDTTGNLFGASLCAADVDGNGSCDLVIVAPGASPSGQGGVVYVVYGEFLAGGSSGALDPSNANVNAVTNSAGDAFGHGAAVGDFNGDGAPELVLGAPRANPLSDSNGIDRGRGGEVFVVWGQTPKGTKLGNVDVAAANGRTLTLLGQATFAGSAGSAAGDSDTVAQSTALMLGGALVDSVGDALALLDFNGDGKQDLAIGAPTAAVAGVDGELTAEDNQTGRVYLLFGAGAWKNAGATYSLPKLYSQSDYKKGLVFEGTATGGSAGWSVASAGSVRGTSDSGCADLLVGAPLVGSNAGQAYLVFGSVNHYDMSSQPWNASAPPNVQWLDPVGDANHPNVPLLFGFQGIVNPIDADNPTNSGNAGRVVAGIGDVNADGAADLVIGAPTADVDGYGQLYVPIGHPWIQPGQHLNVKDLRSDNGFVLEAGAPGVPIGDFDGDGYDDLLILGNDPEIVLGATPLTNVNGVRRYPVFGDGTPYAWRVTWTSSGSTPVSTAVLEFDGVDLDGDGILRGRPTSNRSPSLTDSFSNELTAWQLTVSVGGSAVYSLDLQGQLMTPGFCFNYDLAQDQLIAGAAPNVRTPLALQVGADPSSQTAGDCTLATAPGTAGKIVVQLTRVGVSGAPATSNTQSFVPVSLAWNRGRLRSRTFDWTASGSGNNYTVWVTFAGSDADGDGLILGHRSTTLDGDDELTQLSYRVFDGNGSVLQNLDLATQGNYDFALPFDLGKQLVRTAASVNGEPQPLFMGQQTVGQWVFGNAGNSQLMLAEVTGAGSPPTYTIKASKAAADIPLYLTDPLRVLGPVAVGDFDGDGRKDFVLFENVGTSFRPLWPNGTGPLPVWVLSGSSDPARSAAQKVQASVPLSYISNALAGDVDGDGYDDLVFSGYSLTTEKGMLYAVKGSAAGLDLTKLETLYTETNNVSRYLLSLLDLTGNGQADVVTYTLGRTAMPPTNFGWCTYSELWTYGAQAIGGQPTWNGPIPLNSAIFAGTNTDSSIIAGITAGAPVDLDDDGLVDLAFTIVPQYYQDYSTTSYVIRSTGNFTFEDGNGDWSTFRVSYQGDPIPEPLTQSTPESAPQWPRMCGVRDFDGDGIDDLLVTAAMGVDGSNSPAYSYVIYGKPGLFGQSLQLELTDMDFAGGMAFEGLVGMKGPYTLTGAGDLNGDGCADVTMSDSTHALSYGVYGQRLDDNTQTDYVEGTDDDDVLIQEPSSKTIVNLSGRSGNDFIQTVRTVSGTTRSYDVVVHAGPGDDTIGISTVQADHLRKIDGGYGFDTLFLNPLYSGGADTLDLTAIGRRISGIECIDLGESNGIEFGYVEVRELSEETNTLLLKGSNARAKPVDGDQWTRLGTESYAGVVYDVYVYQLPDGTPSDIQVWLERGGVIWFPIQG